MNMERAPSVRGCRAWSGAACPHLAFTPVRAPARSRARRRRPFDAARPRSCLLALSRTLLAEIAAGCAKCMAKIAFSTRLDYANLAQLPSSTKRPPRRNPHAAGPRSPALRRTRRSSTRPSGSALAAQRPAGLRIVADGRRAPRRPSACRSCRKHRVRCRCPAMTRRRALRSATALPHGVDAVETLYNALILDLRGGAARLSAAAAARRRRRSPRSPAR